MNFTFNVFVFAILFMVITQDQNDILEGAFDLKEKKKAN